MNNVDCPLAFMLVARTNVLWDSEPQAGSAMYTVCLFLRQGLLSAVDLPTVNRASREMFSIQGFYARH